MKKRRSRRFVKEESTARVPQTHPVEQALIEFLPELPGERLLCTTLGRMQFGALAACLQPPRQVTCLFQDSFLHAECQRLHGSGNNSIKMLCQSDPPEEEFDLAILPTSRKGNGELTRDLMQSFHQQLKTGGLFVAATDNMDDTWLQEEVSRLCPKVKRVELERAVIYTAKKQGKEPKLKNFTAEFKFRDHDHLIDLISRPGTFSHRKLDLGARALIEALPKTIKGPSLEIGCGTGAVTFAMALRRANENDVVTAIDSNPRAIECTRIGAERNGLSNIETILSHEAKVSRPGSYQLVVGNPPYFSQFKISELFLRGAHAALKPGGMVMMVTKRADWFEENMQSLFSHVETRELRGYAVVSGRK
ncbi:class I SAM-dependent methyltransferase [Calycomorphotria hydatis]|uniref:Ribosomal RNA large subunit methyltransferase G n=1 Tax=Calycomorphotria hydatis TaxID=2528027 RepID=A0A517TC22_9PLAN|nr:methyltransferase [Calycomorphotria hydatis]QDT65926.1 Ribosomal RNA large subunit methyltransferase G [Calycomorphotria hydatis]